jgi:hypothetical protein
VKISALKRGGRLIVDRSEKWMGESDASLIDLNQSGPGCSLDSRVDALRV